MDGVSCSSVSNAPSITLAQTILWISWKYLHSLWAPGINIISLCAPTALATSGGYITVALTTPGRGKLFSWWPLLLFIPALTALTPGIADGVSLAFFFLTLGGDVTSFMPGTVAALCFPASAGLAYWASRPRSAAFYAACCAAALWLCYLASCVLSDSRVAWIRPPLTCEHHVFFDEPRPLTAHGLRVSDLTSLVVLGHPDRIDQMKVPAVLDASTLGYVYDALEQTGLPYIDLSVSSDPGRPASRAGGIEQLVGTSAGNLLRFRLARRAAGIDCRAWDLQAHPIGDPDGAVRDSEICVLVEPATTSIADAEMSTQRDDRKSGYELKLRNSNGTDRSFFIKDTDLRVCELRDALAHIIKVEY